MKNKCGCGFCKECEDFERSNLDRRDIIFILKDLLRMVWVIILGVILGYFGSRAEAILNTYIDHEVKARTLEFEGKYSVQYVIIAELIEENKRLHWIIQMKEQEALDCWGITDRDKLRRCLIDSSDRLRKQRSDAKRSQNVQ